MAENALTPGGIAAVSPKSVEGPAHPPVSKPAAGLGKAAPIVGLGAVHPEDRNAKYASAPPEKPTKRMEERRSVPSDPAYNTSGIERAMGAMADKMHVPKRRK